MKHFSNFLYCLDIEPEKLPHSLKGLFARLHFLAIALQNYFSCPKTEIVKYHFSLTILNKIFPRNFTK